MTMKCSVGFHNSANIELRATVTKNRHKYYLLVSCKKVPPSGSIGHLVAKLSYRVSRVCNIDYLQKINFSSQDIHQIEIG